MTNLQSEALADLLIVIVYKYFVYYHSQTSGNETFPLYGEKFPDKAKMFHDYDISTLF